MSYIDEWRIAVLAHAKVISSGSNYGWFQFGDAGIVDPDSPYDYHYPAIADDIVIKRSSNGFRETVSITLKRDASTFMEDINDYAFVGRPLEIWVLHTVHGLWYQVFKGVTNDFALGREKITFRSKGAYSVFDKEMNPAVFSGDATTYEGAADLKGVTKPILFGEATNITPILLNAANLIYGMNWNPNGTRRAISGMSQLRDQGVNIPWNADYATAALLLASTPPTGNYNSCWAEGLVKLGSAPAGRITCSPYDNNTDKISEIVSLVESNCSAYTGTTAYVNQTDIDSLYPQKWHDQKITWLDMFQDLIADTTIVTYLEGDGDLYIKLPKVADASVATFTDQSPIEDDEIPIVSIDSEQSEPPPKEIKVFFRKNFSIQSSDEMAGSVTNRDEWSRDHRSYVLNNSSNTAGFTDAKRTVLENPFWYEANASNIASWYQAYRGKAASFYTIECRLMEIFDLHPLGLEPLLGSDPLPGDNVLIKTDKFKIDAATKYRVLETEMNLVKKRIKFRVIGERV